MFNVEIKNYFRNPILISDSQKTEKGGIFNPTAIVKDEKIFLFYQVIIKKSFDSTICLAISEDGINFKKYNKNPIIEEKNAKCTDPRIIKTEKGYFLIYKVNKNNKIYSYKAFSKNLFDWKKRGETIDKNGAKAIIQDYKYGQKYVSYFNSKNSIKIAFSQNLEEWQINNKEKIVLAPRKNFFDKEKVEIGPDPLNIKQGILLIYNTLQKVKKNKSHSIKSLKNNNQFDKIYTWGLALFNKENPDKILWRLKEPIFSSKNNKIILKSLVKFQEKWFLYYYSEIDNGISVATMDFWEDIKDIKEKELPKLIKFEQNPILEPRENCLWEQKGVFNAGAIYEQGKVYIVYRAITKNDISIVGLAISEDGINISERLDEPIYVPRASFELNPSGKINYNYISGWGHSGCEDPRIVKIEDRFYMIYVAFDGSNPPGVALTSIKVDDFLNRNWKWKHPILISPPRELHKNWVIFPEKIDNQYAILHGLSPKILIEYLDDLNFNNNRYIKSYYHGDSKSSWHDWVRGAGPPPIKTSKGWLVFYHAMESRDRGKYKLGAMLLDLKNPNQVLVRSKRPVLEPNMNLNIGKPGVVYSCGAIVIEDKLFVYYGRNDYNLGVATANLDEFLEKLIKFK